MAIYIMDKNDHELNKVDQTNFNKEGIYERDHLQAAIKKQIDVISPGCLVISEEFSEWDCQRRIDLLAIDKNANIVVIELKRTETGEHMELQALRYAAMVSTLTFKQAVEIYKTYLSKSSGKEQEHLGAEQGILTFLEWEEPKDDFALDVKIILVSSNFSKELTTTVLWLNERNIDIRCIRLMPYNHQGQLIIDIQQIIPLPEAEAYQIKIKQQSEERRDARKSLDSTTYMFNSIEYEKKRRLVLAVIHKWVKDWKDERGTPPSIGDLRDVFRQNMRGGGMFVEKDKAQDRHFTKDSEIITLEDGEYAISNQWSKYNIDAFINAANEANQCIQILDKS